jgi:hypothetical protein
MHSRDPVFRWLLWALPSTAALALMIGSQSSYERHQPGNAPEEKRTNGRKASTEEGGAANVGEAAGASMPKGPLPGQRRPPCELRGERAFRGGCWLVHTSMKPPCKAEYYELGETCYLPSMYPPRPPTSLMP